jgi:hypothetical protein
MPFDITVPGESSIGHFHLALTILLAVILVPYKGPSARPEALQ